MKRNALEKYKSRLHNSVIMPADLGVSYEAEVWDRPNDTSEPHLTEEERAAYLIVCNDLGMLDRGSLIHSDVIHKGAPLPSGPAEIKERLTRMVLRSQDPRAVEMISKPLGLEINDSTEELARLEKHDRDGAYRHTMEGALGSALSAMPYQSYGDRESIYRFEVAEARTISESAQGFWLAEWLQMEAWACRDRLRHPTGLEVLDGLFGGVPTRSGKSAAEIEAELDMVEEVHRLYWKHLRGKPVEVAPAPANSRLLIGTPASVCSIEYLPDLSPSPYRAGANANDVEFLVQDRALMLRAHLQLQIWRAQHGDQLEAYIEHRMREARRALVELRHEIEAIRSNPTLRNERLHSRHGISPLARFWLACERAIAFVDAGPIRAGSARPPIRRDSARRVQKLFFAYRCAIIRDPDYLPKCLKAQATVVDGSPARLDGSPFPFEQVWSVLAMRDVNPRKEAFSTGFSKEASDYVEAHGPDDEIVHAAWGPLRWRLNQ
jgi:hypothetical protein